MRVNGVKQLILIAFFVPDRMGKMTPGRQYGPASNGVPYRHPIDNTVMNNDKNH